MFSKSVMSSGGTSLYGVTYVRHPIEVNVSTIVKVVGLRKAKEAAFRFCTWSR